MERAGISLAKDLGKQTAEGARKWLFLDYDGTLAEFAPTPDTIIEDQDLAELLERLAGHPDVLRVVILSGRRLSHIQRLIPVPGILLAGTYGIEFRTWEGDMVQLLDFDTARPFLDQVKTAWGQLIGDSSLYYLEDKGYAIALHARRAPDKNARQIIAEATRMAKEIVEPGTFRILGGYKFIEVAPIIADKGQSLSTLLKRFPWSGAGLLYFGDDDKDEEAFQVVRKLGGTPFLVSAEPHPSQALYRLETPWKVRDWLSAFADVLEAYAQEKETNG